jgi:hypothetical protein
VSPVIGRSLRALFFVTLLCVPGAAAPKPPKADQVLADARAKAAEQHKAIFLIFGASWCAECHNMDRFLALPEVSAIFDKYFVVTHLDTLEAPGGGKASLENPGANQLLAKFGGVSGSGEIGFPFMVVLDEKASPLITSNRPAKGKPDGEGIGFPAEPGEIAWFLNMLHRGAPTMTSDEALVIKSKL